MKINLPKKWVYVTFRAETPGELWTDPLTRQQFPQRVLQDWLITGGLDEAKANTAEVWEKARAGRNWLLKEVNYYANDRRRKIDARNCVRRGDYT